MLDCGSKESKLQKLFKGSQTAWNNFLKPTINNLAPIIGTVVGTKSKNAQIGAATANILKSLTGGKIFSLTALYRNGFRFKII